MLSLSKLLAGRKRDSAVWEFFTYDQTTGKSTCNVVENKAKTSCNIKLAGKNSSNLVAHLKRSHKDAFECYTEKERVKQNTKRGVKRTGSQAGFQSQTLQACIQRRVIEWPDDSAENKQRQEGVMNMIVSTGYPVALLDQPSFRDMIKIMDPKFKVPGTCSCYILFFISNVVLSRRYA